MFTPLRPIRSITVVAVTGLLLGLLPGAPAGAQPGTARPAPDGDAAAARAAAATPDCAALSRQMPTLRASGRTGGAGCIEKRDAAPKAAVTVGIPCGRGSWAYTRHTTCFQDDYQYQMRSVPDNTIVGYVNITLVVAVSVNSRSLGWGTSFEFIATGQAGWIGEPTIHILPSCGSNCSHVQPGGGTELSHPFGGSSRFTEVAYYETPWQGAETVWRAQAYWAFYFSNPFSIEPVTGLRSISPPSHRCDDQLGIPTPTGCVFDAELAHYQIRSWEYPSYARHVQLAISYGVTNLLTRHRDPALRDAHRAVSCPGGQPRPSGKECDEYPFASTLEGAASQPFGTTFLFVGGINGPGVGFSCGVSWLPLRRTYTPGGFSACFIDAGDNSGGGTDLAAFYINFRVIPNDQFLVSVT